MLALLVGVTLTVLGAWRLIAMWQAVRPADLDLPDGPKGWPFGAEWWCKGVRSASPGVALFTGVMFYGLGRVAPEAAWFAQPASTVFVGIGLVLFFLLWNTGKPQALIPPLLRNYDCRALDASKPSEGRER